MSRFKPYPEYKDSGVEWLGEVPVGWEVVPLKRLAILNPGKSSLDVDRQQLCSFVPMEKLMTGQVLLDEERPIDTVFDGYTYFEDGDILQAKVTPCFENGNIALAEGLKNGIGFGSTEINVLRPHGSINSRYLFYRVQEDAYMRVCTASMLGAGGLKRVPTDTVNNFKIAAPAEEEQTQIARFLDHETARIDALIAEQERLIDLLKEKRQAVISHAVTKGLSPETPMIDSGVEWLGDVPAHWEVRRISSVSTKITNGYVGPTRDILRDSGVRYLQSLHIKANQIRFDVPYFVDDEWNRRHAKSVLYQGDVLIVQTGDIGQVAVVTEEFAGCNCHALIIVSPRTDVLSGEWLAQVLNSSYGFRSLLSIQTGALHPHLNCGNVKELVVPVPPCAEQADILSFLSTELCRVDVLMQQATGTVDLLRERRSALISAAVTGKIDVRDWQPPAGVDTRSTVDPITTTEPA